MTSWRIPTVICCLVASSVLAAWWWLAASPRPAITVTQTAQVDGLFVTLGLDTDQPSARVAEVTVLDSTGKPADVSAVQLHFTMTAMHMGEVSADAKRVGNGQFQAQGPFFSMVGAWQVEAVLQRPGRASTNVPFTLAVAALGEANGPTNPLAADTATLAAGQQLYAAHCATCHGATGGGDGPAGAGLNPRPGNFHEHMISGLHTDGQIFLWIQNGYPGSAMPAWGKSLSEQQIWQLVTYIRTFGQTSAPASGQEAIATPAANLLPLTQEPLPSLVFVRNGNIWRSAGDGTPPVQLTALAQSQFAQNPAYAPDGKHIAFVTVAPPSASAPVPLPVTQLYVMAADGTGLRTVWHPQGAVLSKPTWSADGTALYVGSNGVQPAADGNGSTRLVQIVRVELTTGATNPILNDALDPSLSVDGKQLVYLQLAPNNTRLSLRIAASDGSNAREVLNDQVFASIQSPRLSPDGSRIVFAAYGGQAARAIGGSSTGSTSSASPMDALLAWLAPAVAEAHGPPTDLWEVNIDGSGLHRMATLQEDTPTAAFSPDGKEIAVMGVGGIYRMNADGSHLRRIDPTGDHGGLDWER